MTVVAYPTLVQVKTYLVVTKATDDAALTSILAASVAFVERRCERSFLEEAGDTVFVLPGYPNILDSRSLLVKDFDLVSVTTITNGDDEVVSNYILHPLSGPPFYKIEIHKDAGQVWTRGPSGSGLVTISGNSGFAAVPDDIFQAIYDLVQWKYRARSSGAGGTVTTASREGLTIAPSQVPPDILQVLDMWKKGSA